MDHTYWLRQTDKSLFPELEWSRPETRHQAGKLLIIGGNGYEFKSPANAYGDALEAGVGDATVLLPNSMQRVVSDIFPESEFAPSTPSGSFARTSLAVMLDMSKSKDAVLIAGDVGRNSETTVTFEGYIEKYKGLLICTKDIVDVLVQRPSQLLERPETLLVLAMGQLRQIGIASRYPQAFTSEMGLVKLVESLHEFTQHYGLHIITRHQSHYIVASGGRVSTTPQNDEQPVWRLHVASRAAVWWLQNRSKPFESLTTSVLTNDQ